MWFQYNILDNINVRYMYNNYINIMLIKCSYDINIRVCTYINCTEDYIRYNILYVYVYLMYSVITGMLYMKMNYHQAND